jgi:hypothetical protein
MKFHTIFGEMHDLCGKSDLDLISAFNSYMLLDLVMSTTKPHLP